MGRKKSSTTIVSDSRSTFDEFVRDVIIEDRVLVRMATKRSSFSYGLRTITITSRELVKTGFVFPGWAFWHYRNSLVNHFTT